MWIKWKHIFKLRNSIKVVSQTSAWGNFLVVQWVGLGAFSVVAQVQSLVGQLRSHKHSCGVKKKNKTKQKNTKKSAWISSSFMWSGFYKVTKIKPVYMIHKGSRKSLHISDWKIFSYFLYWHYFAILWLSTIFSLVFWGLFIFWKWGREISQDHEILFSLSTQNFPF